MRNYLNKRYREKESIRSRQIITIAAICILLFSALLTIIFDPDEKGIHPIIYILVVISVILIANSKRFAKVTLSLNKNDLIMLNIINEFLKYLKLNKEASFKVILQIFEMYDQEKLTNYFEDNYQINHNTNKLLISLSEQSEEIKFFLIYTLMELSSADKLFNTDEEQFLIRAVKLIDFNPISYNQIKSNFIKRGILSESEIIEEQKRKKLAESFLPYNAYKILGVTPTVTKAQLKKIYRKLAKKYHPDKFHGQSKEIIQQAEDKFQQITEAYEIILKHKQF